MTRTKSYPLVFHRIEASGDAQKRPIEPIAKSNEGKRAPRAKSALVCRTFSARV